MKWLAYIMCLVAISEAAPAERPYEYTFTAERRGEHIGVALEIAPFDSARHRLERKNGVVLIDGRVPVGIGPGSLSPMTTFSRFEVTWNGKTVKIPVDLYGDLFNASLSRKNNPVFDSDGSVWTTVSEDGRSVMIEFIGGNDGTSYKTWVVVRKNGEHRRFIEDTTP